MSKEHKAYSNENYRNDGYYNFKGGYISYDPSQLTEYYTIKGFEGKIKNPQITKSKWS
ncbi:MAG: hypothetical protein LLF98_00225 [Clostridium sp.]|uniref:hypothetical protein n=1 Tax=Clostridium sp. TaxID=1506 RepID=UPI0025BF6484|nr:hypothetical protein [Clostridium sp.]MCE5219723.1 hypothetical protein [Clostridium sp.]